MAIYFVQTRMESGKMRVFPLPGQTCFSDPVNPQFHVSCEKSKRERYPEGTVFATTSLTTVGTHYSAGFLCPVSEQPTVSSEAPTQEMIDEWGKYKKAHPEWQNSIDHTLFSETETPAAAPAASSESRIDSLRRQYPCPTIKDDGFFVEQKTWDLLLYNLDSGENTLLYGCQGLGKTEIVLKLGERLGKPVRIYDMGSMHDPMSQMLGTHRLVSDGKNTVSAFDFARFTQDIQEDCIILLDELNRAPSTTLNILMPCLDSRQMLPVEMAAGSDARNIKVSQHCHFIATANIGGRHVGTLPLDPALTSRFLPYELKHLDKNTEAALLVKRKGISMKDALAICGVAEITRKKVESSELSVEISPRETLRCAGLVKAGFSLLQALEYAFLGMYDKDEREIVRRMFVTR